MNSAKGGSQARRNGKWSLAALVLLAGAATSACSSSCTLIGAESGVNFDVGDIADGVPEGATITACVDDRCEKATRGHGPLPQHYFIEDPRMSDQTVVQSTLTVIDDGGTVLYSVGSTVTPRRSQPNGPDRVPTEWGASLTVHPDGSVTHS